MIALVATSTWRTPTRLGPARALATAALFGVSLMVLLGNVSSPFLYFQF